jgi:hypothetical protein
MNVLPWILLSLLVFLLFGVVVAIIVHVITPTFMFDQRLSDVMEDNNLSRRDVANVLGVSQVCVECWENQIFAPHHDLGNQILEILKETKRENP